jgi:hypothetical protein
VIIKSITPHYIGGFFEATEIDVDPSVTVFTGPNDTGKSCALNAFRILCIRQRLLESDVHKDRFGKHQGTWDTDPDVSISATLEITAASIKDGLVGGSPQAGDIVQLRYQGNSHNNGYQIQRVRRPKTAVPVTSISLKTLPKIAQLRPEADIRSSISLTSMNQAEEQLLKLAFGAQFVPPALTNLSQAARSQRLDRAGANLNNKLKQFFPSALPFEFKLYEVGSDGKTIGVSLVDGVQGYVEVGLRGTGIRRLLSLMTLLLQEVSPAEYTVVLLDEPETSLHADAQHQLRRTLEQLAQNPKIQVIYATHSPSMVNPAHPERIRVFSRHLVGDVGTSKVKTLSHAENFQGVRVSLGLTPADSLLYGLVTIVVEGDTEVRCLGPLLRKLDHERVAGFQGLSALLESSHFVCGWGSSISYYCKLARDQNARPIAFLDGDKRREAEDLKKHRVPTIELPRDSEFEQIVPPARYVAAVAEEVEALELPAEKLTSEAFNTWLAAAGLPDRLMFSKQVELWAEQVTGRSFCKHSVMLRAINLTPATEIDTRTLRELADAIRNEFNPK